MAFLLSLEGVQRRDSHPRTEVFSALGQPVLMHGARPSRDQVQQAGRGVILPSCQVHDAGELTGAPAASVLIGACQFFCVWGLEVVAWSGFVDRVF